MAVLVVAEPQNGKFKKGAYEALTYGADLAASLGAPLMAVAVGPATADELASLGQYGATKVFHVNHADLAVFHEAAVAGAVAAVAKEVNATAVVMNQTYNARAVAPRLSVKLQAALLSGVSSLAEKTADGFTVRRSAFTNKAIETLHTSQPRIIVTVKSNAYKVTTKPATAEMVAHSYAPPASHFAARSLERKVATGEVPLPEAEIVVSGGRGIGNEQTFAPNWDKTVAALAQELGATTACSKPIGDLHWRPHHEHVGQTGVQISPNLYIAIGISGAIQHLAGVSASKSIIVINKDAEAPFFKAADYGIVGDAMDVVPRLVEAVRKYKAAHA